MKQFSKLELLSPTDPILNKPAQKVVSEELGRPFLQDTIDQMLAMAAGKGRSGDDSRQMVGLAAVQIGIAKRLILVDMTADGSNQEQTMRVFINPLITDTSDGKSLGREGCWSCGTICGVVERADWIEFDALDRNGVSTRQRCEGFVARIVQHEIDHLDGVRFPDRVPVDYPERLHLVLPEQFEDYRSQWQSWANICPMSDWLAMKNGIPS